MAVEQNVSPDFPFEPRYVDVRDSRMHYVDEGEGDPVLFLHGNPTSSYLWRNIIPHLTPHARCIAPDLIGMGKSGKPDIEYSYADHRYYLFRFIEELGLKNITLVIHDWGSALGFDYAMHDEDNVKGIAFMEAILRTIPSYSAMPPRLRLMFKAFRTPGIGQALIMNANIFVEKVLPMATVRKLSRDEMDHYRAPYPDRASRKPLWRWPNEIPIGDNPVDVVACVNAYNQWLQKTELPKLCIAAEPGAIMQKPLVDWCRENLANCEIVSVSPGLHYIQEDHPAGIGEAIADWYQRLTG